MQQISVMQPHFPMLYLTSCGPATEHILSVHFLTGPGECTGTSSRNSAPVRAKSCDHPVIGHRGSQAKGTLSMKVALYHVIAVPNHSFTQVSAVSHLLISKYIDWSVRKRKVSWPPVNISVIQYSSSSIKTYSSTGINPSLVNVSLILSLYWPVY